MEFAVATARRGWATAADVLNTQGLDSLLGHRSLHRRTARAVRRLSPIARSARPRYDDVIDGIPNLATENVLALLNLAASLLGPGESYVEVGSFYGASLIGAMRGNEREFVAIDRFSFDIPEVRGRPLPPASRAGLEESLTRFGAGSAAIMEGDAFEVIEGGLLGDRRVGVYYWDGPHDYDGQMRGMTAIEPWLADEALIVIDDYDWDAVAAATGDYRRRRAARRVARRDRR